MGGLEAAGGGGLSPAGPTMPPCDACGRARFPLIFCTPPPNCCCCCCWPLLAMTCPDRDPPMPPATPGWRMRTKQQQSVTRVRQGRAGAAVEKTTAVAHDTHPPPPTSKFRFFESWQRRRRGDVRCEGCWVFGGRLHRGHARTELTDAVHRGSWAWRTAVCHRQAWAST